MRDKLYHNLLLFSLFGVAMWFFGNLYEAIVIAPNMLNNTIEKMHAWQAYFVVTNPAFFYALSPLATIALLIVYVKTSKQKTELKRLLRFASIFQIIAYALSIYIITQINLKLFFANLNDNPDQLHTKAVLWNILNIIRIILVEISLIFTFKAYIQTQKNKG
ncbi:MAG TPA: hypothetical protein VN721_10745 [Flavipsychrobacter sp.]|nr:hypothetical protein [Flavipsychrobacter sp.]